MVLGPQFDFGEAAEHDPYFEEHLDAVTTLAHSTPEDRWAESAYGEDLPAHHANVDPHLADVTGGHTSERVRRAMEGYQNTPHLMPPVLLVKRGTWESGEPRYDVADGHHRLTAAKRLGMPHVNSVVVNSPHADSWRDWPEED